MATAKGLGDLLDRYVGVGEHLPRRAHLLRRPAAIVDHPNGNWVSPSSYSRRGSQVRTRLPAGGRWIRTSGTAKDRRDFETAFAPLCHCSHSPNGSAIPHPGTDGSNPPPSSRESGANLTSSSWDVGIPTAQSAWDQDGPRRVEHVQQRFRWRLPSQVSLFL